MEGAIDWVRTSLGEDEAFVAAGDPGAGKHAAMTVFLWADPKWQGEIEKLIGALRTGFVAFWSDRPLHDLAPKWLMSGEFPNLGAGFVRTLALLLRDLQLRLHQSFISVGVEKQILSQVLALHKAAVRNLEEAGYLMHVGRLEQSALRRMSVATDWHEIPDKVRGGAGASGCCG